MIIIEKNAGQKIDYSQSGYLISFGNDELTLNAASYQRDWGVHLNVCYDDNQNLVIGTASGKEYVAELDIPARGYVYPEAAEQLTEDEDGENSLRKTRTARTARQRKTRRHPFRLIWIR